MKWDDFVALYPKYADWEKWWNKPNRDELTEMGFKFASGSKAFFGTSYPTESAPRRLQRAFEGTA